MVCQRWKLFNNVSGFGCDIKGFSAILVSIHGNQALWLNLTKTLEDSDTEVWRADEKTAPTAFVAKVRR